MSESVFEEHSPGGVCTWSSSWGRCGRSSPSRLELQPPEIPRGPADRVEQGWSVPGPAGSPAAQGKRSCFHSAWQRYTQEVKRKPWARNLIIKHSSACCSDDSTWIASTLVVHSLAFCRASLRARILGRYAGMFLASSTMLSKVTKLCGGLGVEEDGEMWSSHLPQLNFFLYFLSMRVSIPSLQTGTSLVLPSFWDG